MAQQKKERIFISYKRVDQEHVFAIKDGIEKATGEKCWIDLDGIESDAQFANVIISAINRCEVFLFMYSKEHTKITDFDEDWTIKEITFAKEKKKRIVILNIDDTPLIDQFLFEFPRKQRIDLSDADALARLYKDLCSWLEIGLSKNQQTTNSSVLETPQDNSPTLFTVNGVSFQMVSVQGGRFTMGATSEQGTSDPYDDEKPTHSVTLSDYQIGETAVTQELWEAVMGSNPSRFEGKQNPVECVSWDDCQLFIQKLNQLTGKRFRLPTEAEWEYAARGGNKSKGYKYAGSNTLSDVAWYSENSGSETHPVKQKRPNELGLYDMSGNVWEWCQDWYGNYSSSAQTNPTGSTTGSNRVLRGGSWFNRARSCRVSFRNCYAPDGRYNSLGLRLAL